MLPYPLSHMVMAPPPQELWIDDLADIAALHADVHHAQIAAGSPRDHGLFARETEEFFRNHLEAQGRIYGLREAGALIAYGVLGLPQDGAYNFGAWAGLPRDLWTRVAHIDGVAVHPGHRGHRLHLVMIKRRLLAAGDFGRDLIYSTASPGNLHSLGNLMLSGFVIVARRPLFGGHDRFILAWADHRAAEDAERRFARIDDAAAQERLLAEGFVGAGGGVEDGHSFLRFVPAAAFRAPWS